MSRHRRLRKVRLIAFGLPALFGATRAMAQSAMRFQNFDTDPSWDSHNNRATDPPPQTITQNFGYSSNTHNAGGSNGEVGGTITPAGERAYYASVLPVLETLNDPLTVSGTLKVSGGGDVFFGFFNKDTANEWRTANSLGLRLYGRGSYFLGYAEYGTSKWRAGSSGGDFNFDSSLSYNFSLTYSPVDNNGGGAMSATIGSHTFITNLDPGHKLDGATFNRFGFLNVMKSYDSPVQLWVDNLTVNGVSNTFNTNPGWEGSNNQITYVSTNVRPRFNFGYSPTHNAGGAAAGEIGGATFRGDSRTQFNGSRMAYYGDTLSSTLTLNDPLQASGKVSFGRGVSDSTTLIGFFHDTDSIRNSDAQSYSTPEDFVGVAIEGPSSDGFYFYPTYGVDQDSTGTNDRGATPPYIYPDGTSHNWTLNYDPTANGGQGQITVTLDGKQDILNLLPGHKALGAHFNRFGIITTQIDGNGQTVYFDDLSYTIDRGPPQWIAQAGNWNSPGNWNAAIPNGVGAGAALLGSITDSHTVVCDSPITLGTLRFDNANTYVLAGNGSLTMQVASGSASIDVESGTQKVNLPLTIASDTNFNVASGATLKISDPITVKGGKSLTQSGAGSVVYESTIAVFGGASITFGNSTHANSLSLATGATATISPHCANPPSLIQVDNLSLGAGGAMDLTDNAAAVNYSVANPIASIRDQVRSSYNHGAWNASGITSSTAAANASNLHKTGIGIAEASALNLSAFLTQPVDSTAVLLRYAYFGDANLDGAVTASDFAAMAMNFNGTNRFWYQGDFNYDGTVNAIDFGMLAANFGQTTSAPVAGSSVPEPGLIGALIVIASVFARRRQRRAGVGVPSTCRGSAPIRPATAESDCS